MLLLCACAEKRPIIWHLQKLSLDKTWSNKRMFSSQEVNRQTTTFLATLRQNIHRQKRKVSGWRTPRFRSKSRASIPITKRPPTRRGSDRDPTATSGENFCHFNVQKMHQIHQHLLSASARAFNWNLTPGV